MVVGRGQQQMDIEERAQDLELPGTDADAHHEVGDRQGRQPWPRRGGWPGCDRPERDRRRIAAVGACCIGRALDLRDLGLCRNGQDAVGESPGLGAGGRRRSCYGLDLRGTIRVQLQNPRGRGHVAVAGHANGGNPRGIRTAGRESQRRDPRPTSCRSPGEVTARGGGDVRRGAGSGGRRATRGSRPAVSPAVDARAAADCPSGGRGPDTGRKSAEA